MDFRKSLSRPFKKLKDKLPGGSRKRDERSGAEDGRSGSRDGRKGRAADVEGSGASQRDPSLHPEVLIEGMVESSGPSQEESNVDGKRATLANVDSPKSPSSIPPIREPDGV